MDAPYVYPVWEFTEAMYFRETENGFDFPVQSFKSDRWPGIVFEVRPRASPLDVRVAEARARRIAQWIEEEILRGT